MNDLQIELRQVAALMPYEKNARTHSAAQIAQIAASIEQFGWTNPILVDADNRIIAGHARLAAATKLKMSEVPTIVLDQLTDIQRKALVIADNQLALNAGWDEELLRVELQALRAEDFHVDLLGFSEFELAGLLASASAFSGEDERDAIPEVPVLPTSKTGDLWILGNHRVLCGDSTNSSDVGRLLEQRRPTLMVTDPPYGIELDSEWRDRAGLNGCGAAEPSYMKKRTKGHVETTISGDTRADWSEAFELVPSLEAAYVWHASRFTREVLDGLLRIGFLHHQQIIWDKGRAVLTRTHYWFQHEPCWYVRKKATIWDSPSPKFIMGGSGEQKFDHPTQKPVELMRKPILNHTKRGQLVYEPFLGSGTTLAAAELTQRHCCGIELDPKYVDVVVQRWQTMTENKAILAEDGRTFEELAEERLGQEGSAG